MSKFGCTNRSSLIHLAGQNGSRGQNLKPGLFLEILNEFRPKESIIQGLGILHHDDEDSPCTLHEARILTHSEDTCKKMLKNAGNDPKELKHAFCGGYLDGGIDSCQVKITILLQHDYKNCKTIIFRATVADLWSQLEHMVLTLYKV